MSWLATLAAVVGGGGLAGVITSAITGLLQRPKVKADAVAMLTDSAIKQVNELQERTAEAERSATEARQQMRLLSGELDVLLSTMRTWRSTILAATSAADLEQLHAMVRIEPGPATNGRRV